MGFGLVVCLGDVSGRFGGFYGDIGSCSVVLLVVFFRMVFFCVVWFLVQGIVGVCCVCISGFVLLWL